MPGDPINEYLKLWNDLTPAQQDAYVQKSAAFLGDGGAPNWGSIIPASDEDQPLALPTPRNG